MYIKYDSYNRVEPFRIYLGTTENRKICCLNGIKPETVSLEINLNNTYNLKFTVDKYISYFGKRYESNGYSWLGNLMRIYVENIGWFIMSQPDINHDGNIETKDVVAESVDSVFVQRDFIDYKFNCGTTDSYEMLVEGNVEKDEYTGVEFAKEQIKFYNPDNPDLSLLDIIIKESDMTDWTVGYVDPIPKVYTSYVDGEEVQKEVLLKDEIGYFNLSGSRNVYAFLTQDIEVYFECLILFDIKKMTINAYRVENLGTDTNIHIGFRNLQNSNTITVDDSRTSVYTRYTVQGADALGIRYVNFGSNTIEDISYYLNTKYLPLELIEKYKLWLNDVENKRPDYIELTRNYNSQLEIISELKTRLPLDDCSTNWDSFSLEELNEKKSDYEAQKLGIEKLFTDANGVVDYDELYSSDLASEYEQIVNVIIPNIEAAIHNKSITSTDEKIESVEDTDWSHYGLDELYVKLQSFEGQRSVLIQSGYSVPWTEYSDHSEAYHTERYNEYLELSDQLDSACTGSCAEAYEERKKEVEEAENILNEYDEKRQIIVKSIDKKQWSSINSSGNQFSFSSKELNLLSKIYNDTDYVNNNMFLVSTDTQVTAIDEQKRLYDAAVNDLSATSQPQFNYSTSLDNFIAITQYNDFTKELKEGNYIRLDVRDDYQVKLRITKILFNPMVFDNELSIEFSNMIKSGSKRSDAVYLLGSSSGAGKNQISGSSNGTTDIDDKTLRALMNKILNSTALNNKINSGSSGSGDGATISAAELDAKLKKVIDLDTGDGSFNYLQAKLISTDKIIADSGEFGDLKAKVAQIDTLLSGSMSAELGHIINLTADNVTIDEAVIRDIIASQITVSMLEASEINTDKFNIASEDGGLVIVGNTMQFYDKNGNIRIQIGRDANDDFTFSLYNAEGTGVLIDENGIHESAIDDGLIKNDMLAGGITKDKLGFNIIEADENGNVDAAVIKINGEGLDVKYTTIERTVNDLNQKIEDNIQFKLELFSSDGVIFTNGVIDTYLQVTLYKGNDDVTNDYENSCFVWSKQSSDADLDDYWNSQHQAGTKILHITNEDVYKRAQFRCDFILNDAVVATTSI